jgi:hypothetical protein
MNPNFELQWPMCAMMENALADLIPTRSIKRNLPLNLMAG